MTVNNEALTRRAITKLIDYYEKANNPLLTIGRRRRAAEQLTAYVEGMHFFLTAQGIAPGAAPFSIELDVIDYVTINGMPPAAGAAFNKPRNEWISAATDHLLNKWMNR